MIKLLRTTPAALSLTLSLAFATQVSVAQTPAPAAPAAAPAVIPAAAAKPAMVAVAAPAKAVKPMKKRTKYSKRTMRTMKSACTKLDDPWGDLCAIKKNAQTACNDLNANKRQVVLMKNKRGKMVKTTKKATANQRQQCVDAYMRNV